MHRNAPFRDKNSKNFLGAQLPPQSLPTLGRGHRGHIRQCWGHAYNYLLETLILKCNSDVYFSVQLRSVSTTRVVENGRPCTLPVYTGVRFPLPELTARVDGCQKMHPQVLGPSTRPVNSGSGTRP